MHYRNKHTKAVVEANGNSPEGRDLAKSDEWEKIDGLEVEDVEPMPVGVIQPPEPIVDPDDAP